MTDEPKRWFSAAELAALALDGFPSTKRGLQQRIAEEDWQRPAWEGTKWRARAGQGGGIEYHVSILPLMTQARVLARHPDPSEQARTAGHSDPQHAAALWRRWETLRETQRDEARRRLAIMTNWHDMQGRQPRVLAAHAVMQAHAIASIQTLYSWERLIEGLHQGDWLPALAPASRASAQAKTVEGEAWDILRADYLRPEKPSFDACLRRLQAIATARGWTLPSARTLRRRIDALPRAVVVKAREGADALKKLYPAQQRTRAGLHALEWVNADGHEFDVFVRWDDGTIGRPVMLAFQDIYSGMLLSWRVDRSEHSDMVRLAYGDLVSLYGIPDHCLLDNGRAFASKKITGGVANRYRFKIRDEEPDGIIKQCGSQVHWATPFAGQSKPIERMFRDFATDLSKHPAFAGAYTGNSPGAKPSNYQNAAVPIETFMQVLHTGIVEHNTRRGRKSEVCRGELSLREAFEASIATALIRRPSAGQERLWLLAAENVKPRKPDGAIVLMGNRYWHAGLNNHMGRSLVVRFDPQSLHENLFVYQPDGRFLFEAEVIDAVGFADAGKAREHASNRRKYFKATAEALALERRLTPADIVMRLPSTPEPAPLAQPRAVRLAHGSAAIAMPVAQPVARDEQSQAEKEMLAAMRGASPAWLRVVRPDEG